jgi:hypothetical protein
MSLKKLATLAAKMKRSNKTKAANLIYKAIGKIAQDFPDFMSEEDEEGWEDVEPTDEELMLMETDPNYEPFEQEIDEAKEKRLKALFLEMELFTEAVNRGQLTPEDQDAWNDIQTEFAEIMSSFSGGFGTLTTGKINLSGNEVGEA